MRVLLAALLLPLSACICFEPGPRHDWHRSEPGPHTEEGGSGGSGVGGTDASPSDFDYGEYRAVELALLPADVGQDIDGDGSSDNNLGVLLDTLVDELDAGSWTPEDELQRLVDEGLFLPLLTAEQVQGEVRVEVLSGFEASGLLVLDPACLSPDGSAMYALSGAFTGAEAMQVGPGSIAWCARTGDAGTLLQLPVERAMLTGSLNQGSADLTLTGALPAPELIELMLLPYLGEGGLDLDGDGQADMSTDEVLDLAWELSEDPAVADIRLADGSRGISVALRLAMVATQL